MSKSGSDWKFLTNQALVLSWIARHPRSTAREIAQVVGVTERTALKIVGELDDTGYISRKRVGRRNTYNVHSAKPLRNHIQDGVTVGDLLAVIAPRRQAAEPRQYSRPVVTGG